MIEFMEGHAIRVIVTMILAKNEEVSSPKVGFKNAGPVPNDSAGFQVMVGKTGEPGRDAVCGGMVGTVSRTESEG